MCVQSKASFRCCATCCRGPPTTLIDERVRLLVSQPSQRAEHRPAGQLRDHLLERGDRHQVGALGAQYRVQHNRAARHSAVPVHRTGHDAVRRGRDIDGNRRAGVPAGRGRFRRPFQLRGRGDQHGQHGHHDRPGWRIDRPALPLRAVATAAGQTADFSRGDGSDRALADRLGRAILLCLPHCQLRRHLWSTRRRRRNHAVVLYVRLRRVDWAPS